MVGNADDAVVEIHALGKFHDFTRLAQIDKEKHLQFAAGVRLHPCRMRRDKLFGERKLERLQFGRLRLCLSWLDADVGREGTLRLKHGTTGFLGDNTHHLQAFCLCAKRYPNRRIRRKLNRARNRLRRAVRPDKLNLSLHKITLRRHKFDGDISIVADRKRGADAVLRAVGAFHSRCRVQG